MFKVHYLSSMKKKTKSEIDEMYQDLKSIDLFLNGNNNAERIRVLYEDIKKFRDDALTTECIYMWLRLESKLSLLAQEVIDILELSNKKAKEIGYIIKNRDYKH